MKRYQFTAELTHEATVIVEAPDVETATLRFYNGDYEVLEEDKAVIISQLYGKGKEVP